MTARPLVSVIPLGESKADSSVVLPAVFKANIRPDIVQFVHSNMNKNKRQPYAVSNEAGHQTSAESWGTGRAVARIPRVSGGGTHRAGQGAFGNMCRKGRMFAPTKIWRKWHRKINVNQRRYATASAIAATALPSLVQARGHRIEKIPECPLVVSDDIQSVTKTKAAVQLLTKIGAYDDALKAKESRKLRAGVGKLRNRRYRQRRGPLIIYDKDDGLTKAFRNLPGVELCNVSRLNLLQLAPGGHLGRFVVWSEGAFKKLDSIWGTFKRQSELKSGYSLPKPIMTNADVARLINSDEIQSVVRPAEKQTRSIRQRKNPLRNTQVLYRLNPNASIVKRAERRRQAANLAAKSSKGKQFIASMTS